MTVIVAFTSVAAQAGGRNERFSDFPPVVVAIAQEVSRCAVQPTIMTRYGRKRYGKMVSRCPSVKVDGQQASVQLGRDVFALELRDSAMSDGDFGDLSIFDARSRLIFKGESLLAYGDVLRALIGEIDAPVPANQQKPAAPQQRTMGGRF